MVFKEAVNHIVNNCTDINSDCKCLIIYDDSTKEIIKYFIEKLLSVSKCVYSEEIELSDRHGEEPSKRVVEKMLQVDLIFCITKYSLAHTNARKIANQMGIPFLSMPEYNKELLKCDAIKEDYKSNLKIVEKVSKKLTKGNKIIVTSDSGTRLELSIEGRRGNSCPGFVNKKYLLGSPPDIEANVAPVEEKTEGIIVVDGSITHEKIGILKEPIILYINNGRMNQICCENKELESKLKAIMSKSNSKSYILGELGIGLNRQATLCGNMLVDEGTYGCVHFGFGSNWTIGGKNKVDFHLDFVIKKPTLTIDNQILIEKGEIL